MATIAGASQYRNASTLANLKHLSAQSPTLLGESGIPGLLEGGRNALRIRGFGVSGSARALNNQLLNSTSDINQMFSLGAGADSNVDGARVIIQALRSKLGFATVQEDGTIDNGQAAASANGQVVDQEV